MYCYLLYFVTFGKEIYTTIKTNYSEEELIVLLKEKNETGFHHLYDNYSGALYGVIFRIVQSKEYTEEIIQDVFVKVWNSIHQYDQQKGRFYTWMINIARNTAIDYLKSKGFQNELKTNLSQISYITVQSFLHPIIHLILLAFIVFWKVWNRINRSSLIWLIIRVIHKMKYPSN